MEAHENGAKMGFVSVLELFHFATLAIGVSDPKLIEAGGAILILRCLASVKKSKLEFLAAAEEESSFPFIGKI